MTALSFLKGLKDSKGRNFIRFFRILFVFFVFNVALQAGQEKVAKNQCVPPDNEKIEDELKKYIKDIRVDIVNEKVEIENKSVSLLYLVSFNTHLGEYREATECNGAACTTKGYNDDGRLVYELNCVKGILHGKQTYYGEYHNNTDYTELNYNNGKLVGRQKSNNYVDIEIKNNTINGKLGLTEFKNSKPISMLYDYNMAQMVQNAKLPFDKNSNLNGDGIYTGEIISTSEYDCYEEVVDGRYYACSSEEYAPKPEAFYSVFINYKDNKPQSFKLYYLKAVGNAAISSKNTLDSIFDYLEKDIRNGEIKKIYTTPNYYTLQGQFDNAKQRTGTWIEKKYYSNNIITTESNYKNGKLDGTLKEWDGNNNLIKAEIYKDGQRVQIIR